MIPATATISGNAVSFKEAITSLLLNAIKYTPAGGTISVRAEPHGESVIIEITDTGIGIPPDEQPRIFEEFYRASNARQMEPDGDGLGLSLVKRIVELHHGTIGFSSELGRGTTFRIVLPLTVPPEVSDPAVTESPGKQPGPKTGSEESSPNVRSSLSATWPPARSWPTAGRRRHAGSRPW